tara:strand:- start:84 stop:410 length:327 start_codon:yes stop_codon:yes gene_type:complete
MRPQPMFCGTPDGKYMAVLPPDNHIRIYDTNNFKKMGQFTRKIPYDYLDDQAFATQQNTFMNRDQTRVYSEFSHCTMGAQGQFIYLLTGTLNDQSSIVKIPLNAIFKN